MLLACKVEKDKLTQEKHTIKAYRDEKDNANTQETCYFKFRLVEQLPFNH